MWKIALLFTVIPLIEAWLLIEVGSRIGPLGTVLMILFTGVLGAWAAKREGLSVLRRLAEDLSKGIPPAARIVEGVLVIVGAILLITPGVLTDLVGIFLVIPLTRRLIAPLVLRILAKRFNFERFDLGNTWGQSPEAEPPKPTTSNPFRSNTPFDHPVR